MKNIEKRINELKCSQNSESKSACLNRSCTNYAFTCGEKSCQCRKAHPYCFMIETQTIMLNFNSKVITNQKFSKIINEQFKKIYDQISKCKNKILKDIAAYFQFYGLSDNQRKLMKSLESEKASEITGSEIWAACISDESKKVNDLDGLVQKSNGFLGKYQQAAEAFFEKFSKTMKDFYNKRETPVVAVVAPTKVEKKVEIMVEQEEYDRRHTQTRHYANNNNERAGQRTEKETTNRRQDGKGYGRGNDRGNDRRDERRDDRRVDNRRQQRKEDPKERAQRRRYQADNQF